MFDCPLSEYLSLFRSQSPTLRNHIERCPTCCPRWSVLQILSTAVSEEPCPDPRRFGDFAAGYLSEDEIVALLRHASTCAKCAEEVRDIVAEATPLPNLRDLLKQADLKLDAYITSKEIADWLATQHRPDEQEAVDAAFDTAFDTVYDALAKEWTEQEVMTPAMALAFEGKASSPTGIIIALALIAGRFGVGSVDAQTALTRFRDAEQSLATQGIDHHLIEATHDALQEILERRDAT